MEAAEPSPGVQVWVKPLAAPGQRAVLLLNRTNAAASVSAEWRDLGLQPNAAATVRDLWMHKDLGSRASSYTASVTAGSAVMLKISGQDGKQTEYRPSAPSANGERSSVTFANVRSTGKMACICIAYSNPDKSPRFAELRVNGQMPTTIAFPSTGGTPGTVTIEAALSPSVANELIFSSPCGNAPALEAISVLGY